MGEEQAHRKDKKYFKDMVYVTVKINSMYYHLLFIIFCVETFQIYNIKLISLEVLSKFFLL